MFDLGFCEEVEADAEASGATSGRGVRRRAWRVRPLSAMRVWIILGDIQLIEGAERRFKMPTVANFLIPLLLAHRRALRLISSLSGVMISARTSRGPQYSDVTNTLDTQRSTYMHELRFN